MKLNVLGGGPAGLYLSLLARKNHPDWDITVYERNPRDNTFGWGVVFSEQTLSYLEGPDAPTFEKLQAALATWDNVDVVHRGEKVTIRGNHFSGVARIALLTILQERCEELGVNLRFRVEIDDVAQLPPADLIVGADGVRSLVRNTWEEAFVPHLDFRPNRYIWYGTPRLFHGLTLTFREVPEGLFIAHSYKFSDELSTFIVECDEESWRRAGLDDASEAESLACLERIFADDLQGESLLSNGSKWVQFVTVRCRHWHARTPAGVPVVLLGDAVHTAHFSIGSGTKLALEDSIALAEAFERHPVASGRDHLEAALADYEARRRPRAEAYQDAAQASLEWFETAAVDLGLSPLAFAYKAMTRSERVDLESIRRRDPAFAAAVERAGVVG